MLIRILFLSYLLQATAWAFVPAQDAGELFRHSFPAKSLGPLSQQAFCIQGLNGQTEGHRIHEAQKIASVTKLFTSLLALVHWPHDQQWTTRIYINGNKLHIEGGLDPWFGEEKMLLLIAALQDRGIKRIDQLSFDPNFIFYDLPIPTTHKENAQDTLVALRHYFTRSGRFGKIGRAKLDIVRMIMNNEGVAFTLPATGIRTTNILVEMQNPLAAHADTIVLTHRSQPLYKILKAMNVYSKNSVAQHLWDLSNSIKPYREVLAKKNIPTAQLELYTGSGLPFQIRGQRVDNQASCQTVLKLMEVLERELDAKHLSLSQVMAVGTDIGTLNHRFLDDRLLKESVLAKTGTLSDTVTLAAWAYGKQRYRLVFLNQNVALDGARDFQDSFVSQLMATERGPPQPIQYARTSLFPVSDEFFEH